MTKEPTDKADGRNYDLLPISPEEYERCKASILSQRGVVVDIDEQTGTVTLSISEEAHARITGLAAMAGLDTETFIRDIWQEQVDRALAKNRRDKRS
jgi:hypothetical protein